MSKTTSLTKKSETKTSARRKFLKLGGVAAAGTAATLAFP